MRTSSGRLAILALTLLAGLVWAQDAVPSAEETPPTEGGSAPDAAWEQTRKHLLELMESLRAGRPAQLSLEQVVPAPTALDQTPFCLAATSDQPCRRARTIASMGACTRAENCPAVAAWKEMMGTPAIELARPRAARPWVRVVPIVQEPDDDDAEISGGG